MPPPKPVKRKSRTPKTNNKVTAKTKGATKTTVTPKTKSKVANKSKLTPTPKPVAKRIFSTLVKVIMVMALLFAIPLFIAQLNNKTPSIIMATWQRIGLLQQELPQENSLPSPLPHRHLTDTWGGARSEGRSHEGIDIFAPRGTPIETTTAGVVSRVGLDKLGGRVVTVIGPGGAAHYYAHMEDYADIAKNDWLDAGEVIGYVGDSGNAKGTPPHVHYGIYINGSAVNPYPLLSKDN